MISYPFPPNASAGAVRSERFARYLAPLGWASEVITIKPRQDLYADTHRLNSLGPYVHTHQTETLDPWLWLQGRRASNGLTRLLRNIGLELFSFPDHMLLWVPYAVQKGLQLIRQGRIDAIYTTSPPHSSHLAGLLLSRRTSKPWVADFRDPWTLNAYNEKKAIQRLSLKLERIMENAVLKTARLVLANTEANRDNLIAAFPEISSKKIVHVPNGWEPFPEHYYGPAEPSLFTIIHAGTFYPRFHPYGLLYAIAAWRSGELDFDFTFPGPEQLRIVLLGARDTTTSETVRRLGLEDIVQIEPWVALDEARKRMCRADLLWATLGTGKQSGTYIPSKLLEYMSAGKPIMGFFPRGEAQKLIENTGTGRVFTSDDPQSVVAYLESMIAAKFGRRKVENIKRKDDLINQLSFDQIAKKLSIYLNQIIS